METLWRSCPLTFPGEAASGFQQPFAHSAIAGRSQTHTDLHVTAQGPGAGGRGDGGGREEPLRSQPRSVGQISAVKRGQDPALKSAPVPSMWQRRPGWRTCPALGQRPRVWPVRNSRQKFPGGWWVLNRNPRPSTLIQSGAVPWGGRHDLKPVPGFSAFKYDDNRKHAKGLRREPRELGSPQNHRRDSPSPPLTSASGCASSSPSWNSSSRNGREAFPEVS